MRLRPLLAVVALGAALLGGCSGDDEPSATPSASPSASASEDATSAPTPERPRNARCYDLAYADALAPTSDHATVPCKRRHTARTFHVGDLDTVVDGHLLAVDSRQVQAQVAAACPRRFASYVGGSPEQRRLSMLMPVWFSPTVEESDAGANWFRCEVVALAGPEQLLPLSGKLRGVLGTEAGRDRYGMCGTAKPGTQAFERVACGRRHTWRAIATVDVPPRKGGRWPGLAASREAGQERCEDAARQRADEPLSFSWGYEWPTREQWRAGRHHGFCWAPTP